MKPMLLSTSMATDAKIHAKMSSTIQMVTSSI